MSLDYTKIAFSSEYPVDKIAFTATGSFSVPGWTGSFADPYGAAIATVPHGLSKACLPEMIWSLDNTNFQDVGMGVTVAAGSVITQAACDSTNCIIYAGNADTSSRTIFYKLFLLWPN